MKLSKYFAINIGKIVKDDFINILEPLNIDDTLLREDMFQLKSNDNEWVLDSGFYHYSERTGAFHTYIIKDMNWDIPYMEYISANLEDFTRDFNNALMKFKELLNSC